MIPRRASGVSVFSLLALLIIIMIGAVLVRVYVLRDFPIFTDEGQIYDGKTQEFGIFAPYL